MEHDVLASIPSHDNLLLLEQSFYINAPSTSFSPRDIPSFSPRAFLTFTPTVNYVPDAVEYDSTGSVGSRRCSDEFSEASQRQVPDWSSAVAHLDHACRKAVFAIPKLPMTKREETKLFPCREPGCRKVYTTTEGLRLHNRNIHMNDKKHKCHIEGCDRAFVRASDLKLHILRIHESERPFPCTEPECNKSFACNSELTRHLNCHNRSKGRKKLRRASDDEDDQF